MATIRLESLTRRFGDHAVADAVSLTIALEYVHLFGEQGQSLRR